MEMEMVSLPHAVTLCPSSSHPLTYCFNIRNCCHQGQDGWLYLIGSKSKLHYGRPIRKWEAVTRSVLKVTAAIVNTLNFSSTASSVNTFWSLLSSSVSLPSKVSIVHSLRHTTPFHNFFLKLSHSVCLFYRFTCSFLPTIFFIPLTSQSQSFALCPYLSHLIGSAL